jgi:putative endonuclease
MWQVYILKCADGKFYTGITTDIKRRVSEHNDSKLGAKFTSSRRPVKLVFSRIAKNRSLASKLELKIKRMSREKKIEMIKTHP